jgi:hypothetical protein
VEELVQCQGGGGLEMMRFATFDMESRLRKLGDGAVSQHIRYRKQDCRSFVMVWFATLGKEIKLGKFVDMRLVRFEMVRFATFGMETRLWKLGDDAVYNIRHVQVPSTLLWFPRFKESKLLKIFVILDRPVFDLSQSGCNCSMALTLDMPPSLASF